MRPGHANMLAGALLFLVLMVGNLLLHCSNGKGAQTPTPEASALAFLSFAAEEVLELNTACAHRADERREAAERELEPARSDHLASVKAWVHDCNVTSEAALLALASGQSAILAGASFADGRIACGASRGVEALRLLRDGLIRGGVTLPSELEGRTARALEVLVPLAASASGGACSPSPKGSST